MTAIQFILMLVWGSPLGPIVVIALSVLLTFWFLVWVRPSLEIMDRMQVGPFVFLTACGFAIGLFLFPGYVLTIMTGGFVFLGILIAFALYAKALEHVKDTVEETKDSD